MTEHKAKQNATLDDSVGGHCWSWWGSRDGEVWIIVREIFWRALLSIPKAYACRGELLKLLQGQLVKLGLR